MTRLTPRPGAALLLAVGLGSLSPALLAASAHPVIVTLAAGLPTVTPTLTDPRALQPKAFGNLRPEVLGHIQRLEAAQGFKATHGYSHALKGFSANLTDAQVAQLRQNPLVQSVEPDRPLHLLAQAIPYGIKNTGATTSMASRAGDGRDNAAPGLTNVRAVVLDTGIASHPDLNLVDYTNFSGDGIDGDCHGHGTHVAGTIGAKDNGSFVVGMAPGVPLVAAKVMDCGGFGWTSTLIQGFDYVASQAKAHPNLKYVVNVSLGYPTGTAIPALDEAIAGAVSAGAFVAVAAGNSGDDTCRSTMVNLSSATTPTGVMAVSAVDNRYQEAGFSSYGACVATWAPGVQVESTSHDGTTTVMSGTSMATPHVTGAAALVRAVHPGYSPLEVDKQLKVLAMPTRTTSKGGRAIHQVNVQGLTLYYRGLVPAQGPTHPLRWPLMR